MTQARGVGMSGASNVPLQRTEARDASRRTLDAASPIRSRPWCRGSALPIGGEVDEVRRRHFAMLLGVSVLAWPGAGHAQQRAIPVIGFLSSSSAADQG